MLCASFPIGINLLFFDLIYFLLLILASAGFAASSGIIHRPPALCAPGMRFSLQRIPTRRWEMPHFSATSKVERYFTGITLHPCTTLYYIP